MHELVIVNGILDALTELSEKEGREISKFIVSVGELASFNKDLIDDLLKTLRKGTKLENSEYEVVVEEAHVICRRCGADMGFKELIQPLTEHEKEMIHFLPELVSSFTKCIGCGSRDMEIKSGRGIRVSYVEFR